MNNTVTIHHAGRTYTATLSGGAVELTCDGVYAGRGTLRTGRIEDCAAVLADGAYDAIEAAIEAEHGMYPDCPSAEHLAWRGRMLSALRSAQ